MHAHRTWRRTRAIFFQIFLEFRNVFFKVGSYVPGFIHALPMFTQIKKQQIDGWTCWNYLPPDAHVAYSCMTEGCQKFSPTLLVKDV